MEFDYNPPTGPLTYLFRDDHLIVMDKPSGLLSVPGKLEGRADCLISRLQALHIGGRGQRNQGHNQILTPGSPRNSLLHHIALSIHEVSVVPGSACHLIVATSSVEIIVSA